MSSTASTKVIVREVMLSYPHLDKPQQPRGKDQNKKPKFSATLVAPQGYDKRALEAAVLLAAEDKWGSKAAQMLKDGVLRSPFRTDVVAKGYPEAAFFINARTEEPPGCVYAHPDPEVKPDAAGRRPPQKIPQDKIREVLYPGAIVNASLRAFAYDNEGNRGVSFALNNVQKVRDGDRLDGRISAEDEFEADLSAVPADLDEVM